MKNKCAIILLSLVYGFVIKAQHYQTVFSDRIAYFSNQDGNVKCIRMDSVILQKDTILFPFSTIRKIDYDCYTPYGPSWIGEKVIVNDSLNLFFNLKNDTIKIKTNALLSESWLAYELTDSTIIIATVIAFDTMTFLGLQDSVKTIGFQVYDKLMIPRNQDLNTMTIKISKNFGLVKTFDFYWFPEYSVDYFLPEQLQEYELIGLSKPKTGVQNLTWFDVFDFQVGDEIHSTYESSLIFCPNQNAYKTAGTKIEKYLSRVDYPDSIVYEIQREQNIRQYWTDSSFAYIHDTIRKVITQNPDFDKLPGEPIINEYEAYVYAVNNRSKTSANEYEKIWPSIDSCWSDCCYDGGACSTTYTEGLGETSGGCFDAFMCYGESSFTMVYYKKGEKTWGTPLIITEIPDIGVKEEIEIYPNPAIEKIWVKTPSSNLPVIFELVDLSGITLIRQEIFAEITLLYLDENLKGIYLYKIINEHGIVGFGKLLVE